jgi:glycerophosphoryl diester phosphodiesterase
MNASITLKCFEVVEEMQKNGFIVCTFGVQNNEEELINQQLKKSIRGICSDNVQRANTVVEKYSFV